MKPPEKLTEARLDPIAYPDLLLNYLSRHSPPFECYLPLLNRMCSYREFIQANRPDVIKKLNALLVKTPENIFLAMTLRFLGKKVPLTSAFRKYVNVHYPNLYIINEFLLNKIAGYSRSFAPPDIFTIFKWHQKFNHDDDCVFCSECDSVLSPDFDHSKGDVFICSNLKCTASKSIWKYFNHCWQCQSAITSDFNRQCKICGWYICNNCNSCEEGCAKDDSVQDNNAKKFTKSPPLRNLSTILHAYYKRKSKEYYENLNFRIQTNNLQRGKKILVTSDECTAYIALYMAKHCYKLFDVYARCIDNIISDKTVSIVDWGAGQALGSATFCEYIKLKKITTNLSAFTLIEPSSKAINIGKELLCECLGNYHRGNASINIITKPFNHLTKNNLLRHKTDITIHIFSNILDVESINITNIVSLIFESFNGKNICICTGPNYLRNRQAINNFYDLIQNKSEVKILSEFDSVMQAEVERRATKHIVSAMDYISRYEKTFLIEI